MWLNASWCSGSAYLVAGDASAEILLGGQLRNSPFYSAVHFPGFFLLDRCGRVTMDTIQQVQSIWWQISIELLERFPRRGKLQTRKNTEGPLASMIILLATTRSGLLKVHKRVTWLETRYMVQALPAPAAAKPKRSGTERAIMVADLFMARRFGSRRSSDRLIAKNRRRRPGPRCFIFDGFPRQFGAGHSAW